MLGRLEMTVDECLSVYQNLMKTIFEEKESRYGISKTGNIKARFSTKALETAIKKVIASIDGMSETDLLNDGQSRGCRV